MTDFRVTEQMIKDRENVGGYPFLRITKARDQGMVEVQRATRATPPARGQIDWQITEWAPPLLRQGSPEELRELEAQRSPLARAADEAAAAFDRDAGMLDELAKIREQQEASAQTAVCGCYEDPKGAAPCSDAEELKCEHGPLRILTIPELLARTRQRPPSCPRRREWLASRAISSDEVRARCVKRRIPSSVMQVLMGPKDSIQDRPALLEVRKWAPSEKSFLALCGSNQAGKSFAVGTWLNSLARDGLFISQFDIRNAIIPDPEDKAYALIRQATDAHALVIDNIEGSISDAVKEIVEGLVIKFHGAAKKIAITTSLSTKDFLALWRAKGASTGPVFERLVKYGTVIEVPPWGH